MVGINGLADRVRSSVAAGELGMSRRIEISPVSGTSNVKYWLEAHGYDAANGRLAGVLFDAARTRDRALSDEECRALPLSGGA
jgi:hypothetical protein